MRKMKVSKVQASTQRECGVWLDTAELRGKRAAVRPPRPIYRLLNPLAPPGGYGVSVSLSFTQTKLRFPATTQSSITSFLSPHRHGTDESSSATPGATASGRKRKYSGGSGSSAYQSGGSGSSAYQSGGSGSSAYQSAGSRSPVYQSAESGSSAYQSGGSGNSAYQSGAAYQSGGSQSPVNQSGGSQSPAYQSGGSQSPAAQIAGYGSLAHQSGAAYQSGGSGSPAYQSGESGSPAYQSGGSRSPAYQSGGSRSPAYHSGGSRSSAYQNGRGEVLVELREGVVSLLRPLPQARPAGDTVWGHSPPRSEEEEDDEEPTGKRLCTQTLRFHFTQDSEGNRGEGKENRPQAAPSPPSPSPRKRPLRDLTEAESHARLFTQDSEGRLVIAHRGPQPRTPLKDRTNRSGWGQEPWTAPSPPVLQGEPGPELLLTQDSEGNAVIKH